MYMKRLNIPLVADSLLSAATAFLIAFTLTRFYTKNSALSLVLGIVLALSVGVLAYLYIRHRHRKVLGISSSEKDLNNLKTHLCLIDELSRKKLLNGIYVPSNEDFTPTYFYNFKFSSLTVDDILPIIQSKKEHKIILCNSLSSECKSTLKCLDIKFLELPDIFNLLKDKDKLPDNPIELKDPHISLVERIRTRFSRKIVMPLFFSGLSLVALSYFTFYPVYYIVVGGILLLLSQVAVFLKIR